MVNGQLLFLVLSIFIKSKVCSHRGCGSAAKIKLFKIKTTKNKLVIMLFYILGSHDINICEKLTTLQKDLHFNVLVNTIHSQAKCVVMDYHD